MPIRLIRICKISRHLSKQYFAQFQQTKARLMMTSNHDGCIFCQITAGKDEKTTLLYQDEKLTVFSDIRPAADHHYLVCPREHIRDAKVLTKEHLPLVESMIEVGKKVLNEKNGDVAKARFGFHWPPFCSVHHLHLHVISPVDGMRTFPWLIGMFSPNMPWFRSVEWVLERMKTSDEGKLDT